jgi:hypothetical protein
LTIDHVNSDGNVERRQSIGHTGRKVYKMLKRLGYPATFRVLCWNCNTGRAINGGICPHADVRGKLTAEMVVGAGNAELTAGPIN